MDRIIVDRLRIRHVRCFDDAEIRFWPNSTLLLGINGRGKSAVLQLLALGLSGVEKPPVTEWINIVKSGREADFEIHLATQHENFSLKFLIDEADRVRCVENADKYKSVKDGLLILAYGASRNFVRGEAPRAGHFEEIASLFGVSTYLKNIRDSDTYHCLQESFEHIRTLTNRIFGLADKTHKIRLADFDTKTFYFETPTSPDRLVRLESMSEGFRSVFVWLFDMIVRAYDRGVDIRDARNLSGIVMIDEIDNHLHPSWQRRLLPALEEIFPNIQFVYTSHSPFIVQSMKRDHIILLSMEGQGVRASNIRLDGRPCGYEIEKIIELTLDMENDIPEISDWLSEKMKAFENAVEAGDKEEARALYEDIRAVIPKESSFNEYLEIMCAGIC